MIAVIESTGSPLDGEALLGIDLSPELQKLHDSFRRWIREVRDPANESSEGVRRLTTHSNAASAEYEIARLSSGRYALQTSVSYHTDDCSGVDCPWEEIGTRDECVAEFLRRAKAHFCGDSVSGAPHNDSTSIREQARLAMLALLSGDGLFGFLEPEVDQERSRWYAEIRRQAIG
jgi:hypothetical protein